MHFLEFSHDAVDFFLFLIQLGLDFYQMSVGGTCLGLVSANGRFKLYISVLFRLLLNVLRLELLKIRVDLAEIRYDGHNLRLGVVKFGL